MEILVYTVWAWICLESEKKIRGQVYEYNKLFDELHYNLQFDFVVLKFLRCLIFESVFSSVYRQCTRNYWLEKPFKEEGEQKVILKIGMVTVKLCMQSGHLFTCVAQMIQVALENWFQISFLGYYYYYYFFFITFGQWQSEASAGASCSPHLVFSLIHHTSI